MDPALGPTKDPSVLDPALTLAPLNDTSRGMLGSGLVDIPRPCGLGDSPLSELSTGVSIVDESLLLIASGFPPLATPTTSLHIRTGALTAQINSNQITSSAGALVAAVEAASTSLPTSNGQSTQSNNTSNSVNNDDIVSTASPLATAAPQSGTTIPPVTPHADSSVIPLPAPTPLVGASVRGPAPTPANQQFYTYNIKSLNKEPVPRQAPQNCFVQLPEFPSNGHGPKDRNDAAWLPYLKAMGLTRDVFHAISIENHIDQSGRVNAPPKAPYWNYIIYTLIAVSPLGKLELNEIYNLALAWSSNMTPNYDSCRHSLTTKQQFRNEHDGYWRLAFKGEPDKIVDSQDGGHGSKKKATSKKGTGKGKAFLGSTNGSSAPLTNPSKRGQKRNQNDCEGDEEYEAQDKAVPKSRATTSRKRAKAASKPKDQDESEAEEDLDGGPGLQTAASRQYAALYPIFKTEEDGHSEYDLYGASPRVTASRRHAKPTRRVKQPASGDDIYEEEVQEQSSQPPTPPTTTRSGPQTRATQKALQAGMTTPKTSPSRKRKASNEATGNERPTPSRKRKAAADEREDSPTPSWLMLAEFDQKPDKAASDQKTYQPTFDKAGEMAYVTDTTKGKGKAATMYISEVPDNDIPKPFSNLQTMRSSSVKPEARKKERAYGTLACSALTRPLRWQYKEPEVVETKFHKRDHKFITLAEAQKQWIKHCFESGEPAEEVEKPGKTKKQLKPVKRFAEPIYREERSVFFDPVRSSWTPRPERDAILKEMGVDRGGVSDYEGEVQESSVRGAA